MNANGNGHRPPAAVGRPSKKTPQTKARLLAAIRAGVPFKGACKAAGLSVEAFCQWRRQDPAQFGRKEAPTVEVHSTAAQVNVVQKWADIDALIQRKLNGELPLLEPQAPKGGPGLPES